MKPSWGQRNLQINSYHLKLGTEHGLQAAKEDLVLFLFCKISLKYLLFFVIIPKKRGDSMTVEDIVDDLLKNVTYSPKHQEIREHIVQALNQEYDKILEKNGYTELLSLAELIQSYGTLEQAGRLAGYSLEEIESWTKEGITKYSDFKKQHLISRFHILFSSFLLTIDLAFLFNTFYFGIFFYLIPIIVNLPYLVLYGIKYKKWMFKENRFSCEIYHKIEFLSSQYFKKTINSSLLGIFTLAMGISLIFLTNYRGSELFSQIFSSIIIFEVLFFCIFKNIGYTIYYHFIIRNSKEKLFQRHLVYILSGAAGYWLVTVPIIALVNNTVGIILAVCFSVIYFGLGLFYILKFRKDITIINLRINKKRIMLLGSIAIIVLLYQYMRLDSWLLQPYINQISTVEIPHSEISYNDQNGVYTIQTQEEEFKILQLTDIHLGGSNFSYSKDKRALFSVYTLIEYTKPDLVIVTGDLVFPLGIMSFSFNNNAPIMQFASFMRNIGVPWAFTYGNHDTESLAILTEDAVDSLFKSLSFKRSRNLLYPYIQPNIYGRNNQIIEIRGKENQLIQALFLLDSNSYIDTGVNNYDYIHDDQVEWYEKSIQQLSLKEGKTISSLAFFHMPLNEYQEAYTLYKKGSNAVIYHYGEIGEKNEDICDSTYHSMFFEKAYELGSTKGMFCGHDHLNNISLTYKGIRLTYGLSIDYLAYPGIDKLTEQRGATLITLHNDSSFDILPIQLTEVPINN